MPGAARGRCEARDERGLAASSSVAVAATLVVLAAALFGLLVSGSPAPAQVPSSSDARAVDSDNEPAARSGTDTSRRPISHKQPTDRDERARRHPRAAPRMSVEVYNNSGIGGLATSTAARLRNAGWQVVATDNWYGDIPASTVYFPAAHRGAAHRLARVLGIERVWPAVAPMRFDRLTVILTNDYPPR